MPASKAQAEAMPAATEKDDVDPMFMSKPMSSAGQPLPCLSDECATPPKTETAPHIHTHLPHLQRRGSDVCCNCNGKPDAGRMPRRLNHPVWPMHLNGGAAAWMLQFICDRFNGIQRI